MSSEATDADGKIHVQKDDLTLYGIPGEHALFARTFDDGSGPNTWSLNGEEEIRWAIEALEELLPEDTE